MYTINRKALYGLAAALAFGLLVMAGCATAERPVAPAGSVPCTTDAECQIYDPAWLCDFSIWACYDPGSGEIITEVDGDFEEEVVCTYACSIGADCEMYGLENHICANHCCVPWTADGDVEEYVASDAKISYPETVNFGSVLMGHTVCKDIVIKNDGNLTPLIISGVTYPSTIFTPEFILMNLPNEVNPSVPSDENTLTLNPVGANLLTFEVCYSPADAGIDEGEIYINSNCTETPYAIIRLVSDYKGDSKLCWTAELDDAAPEEATIQHYGSGEPNEAGLIDYGDIDVGGEPASAYIKIWNCGDATGNHVLSITDIRLSGINYSFSLRMDRTPDPVSPILLPPKGTVEPTEDNGSAENLDWIIVKTTYAPDSPIQWPRLHSEHLEILNDSSNPEQRLFVIDTQGSAQNMILEGMPNPVYCGPTPYFDPENGEPGQDICEIRILNRSPNEMLITKVETIVPLDVDTPYQSFAVVNPMSGVTLPGSQSAPSIVEFYYRPQPLYEDPHDPESLMIPRDDEGILRVSWCKTSNPDCRMDNPSLELVAQRSSFRIFAKGRAPNIPPVARISTMPHGPQLTAPLNSSCGVDGGSLFGDTSYDIDSQSTLCGMQWEWEEDYGDAAVFTNADYYRSDLMDYAEHINFAFTKSGTYRLRLNVWDCDPPLTPLDINASEAARLGRREAINENLDNVAEFRVVCDAGLNLRMNYGGCDGKAQVDLIWKAPNGISCSEKAMNSMHTCNFGDYGHPIVSSYATQCMDGSYEEIVHSTPTDGTYMLCAKMTEDCDHWGFNLFGEELCLDKADPDFTIALYEVIMQGGSPVSSTSPKYTVTGRLTSQGDMRCWSIRRENGSWDEPPTPLF